MDVHNAVGLGSLFGLFAGLFYGAYYIATQRSRQHLDALSAFWLSGLSSMVLLFIAALLLDQRLVGYSATTYLDFLALGLIVQVGGQLAIGYALGYLPASVVSPTVLLQAVITAMLAIPLLGESLSFLQTVGGIAVLIGIYTGHRGRASTAS